MSKDIWKAGTVLYPVPVVMVSCGEYNNSELTSSNIITIAWTGTINTDPPMLSISIRPERYSYDIIKNTGEFVVNLVTKKLAFANDYCGVKSGRDVDKFQEMHLTPVKGELVNAPIIYESPVNIECKVKDIIELGTHHMFLGEIKSVSVSKEYFDETNKFHFNKSEPICYSHGGYYSLGENLGSFGYSVRKNKPKKNRSKSNNKTSANTKNSNRKISSKNKTNKK